MSYWVPSQTTARANRLARRHMDDDVDNPRQGDVPGAQILDGAQPICDSQAGSQVDGGVQAADVAAASQLLQSLGIAVGAAAPGGADRSLHYEKPANLGLKLPVFKGEPDKSGRVSQHAVQDFLDRIDAYFSSNAGQYASDANKLLSLLNCFPFGSPSAIWWASLKGTCFSLDEFRVAFKAKYGFDERDVHYMLEKFTNFKQRDQDTVVVYHTNFTQLVTEMTLLLNPADVPSAATQRARFLNGLRPEIKTLVMRTVTHHPRLSLYDVMQEAIMEERQLPRRPRPQPRMNSFQHRRSSNRRQDNACRFCKATDHGWDDCPVIAERKQKGTWKEKPSQGKQ